MHACFNTCNVTRRVLARAEESLAPAKAPTAHAPLGRASCTLGEFQVHAPIPVPMPVLTCAGDGTKIMTSDAALSMLLSVLRERHCAALMAWPASAGGGAQGVTSVVLNVVDVLQVRTGTALHGAACSSGSAVQVLHPSP